MDELRKAAERILELAREHNHPLIRAVGNDVEGLARQLKEDVRWVKEYGRGGILETGNYRLQWNDADHALLTIYRWLPNRRGRGKILETMKISFTVLSQ